MRPPYERCDATASSFLIGFVITMMMQGGMNSTGAWLRAR
jgi:hypothetical protein